MLDPRRLTSSLRGAGLIALPAMLAAAATVGIARADQSSDLQARVRAALRNATSFVETVTVKPNPYVPLGATLRFTVVAPNRYHQTVSGAPPQADDTIIIGHEVYGKEAGGWTVETWSDRLVISFEADVFDVTVRVVGPDRTVDGKTVGSFVMKDPRGAKDTDTLDCTYDKQTFRLLTCSSAISSITYSNYDDPAVTIETPKNAKRLDK